MDDFELTPLEKDLATEMFSLGMNRAAYALSQLTSEPVEVEIPEINISSFDAVAEKFLQKDACIVSQSIEGSFSGTALLIFTDTESSRLVEKILDRGFSRETLSEMGEDTLKEVGNIVLNACVGSMANWLSLSFEVGLPEFSGGQVSQYFSMMGYDKDAVALDIKISMSLPIHQSEGSLSFVLGPVSLRQFKALLAAKLAEIGAQPSVTENV